MKKVFITILLTTACMVLTPPQPVQADPITIIIKEAVKKVIKAMDLAVQRLQNVTIKLQNAQKAIENAMNKLKLKEIAEWGEKQRSLFAGYYDELWKVKSAIAYYKRIKDIVAMQIQVVGEYKKAVSVFSSSKGFTPKELDYMLQVYSGILQQSIQNVDQISIVINSFSTQMTDAKRLVLIKQNCRSNSN